MNDLEIIQFEKHSDTYGINLCVLLHDKKTNLTASIDAFEFTCIDEELTKRGWQLDYIFSTHKHNDHVGGNLELKAKYNCKIYGPNVENGHIPGRDIALSDADNFEFAGHKVEIIATPGHTMDQIAYYLPNQKSLFAADALFSLGCGRMFEGTPEILWQSLKRLASLPSDTKVYCGHEYTQANGKFALSIEGNNQALVQRMQEVKKLRELGQNTIPTSIEAELKHNPFLRPHSIEIRENLGMIDAADHEIIGRLRNLKDEF